MIKQQFRVEVEQAFKAIGERGKFKIVAIILGHSIIHKNGTYYGRYDHIRRTFVD